MTHLRHLLAFSLCMSVDSPAAQFGDFTYTDEGETITISDYPTAATGAVVIPSTVVGKPVTRIGNSAFTDCKQVTSITLPSTVTHLGVTAFEQCDSMVSINLPPGLVSIGRDCFYGCDSLVSISMPASVTEMGRRAFAGCVSLQTVQLSANLTEISEQVFRGCYKLGSITIPSGVQTISTGAFDRAGLTSISLPADMKSIAPLAFTGSKLQSVVIPASVEAIGLGAFRDCNELESVTIASGSTRIEAHAFRQCVKLTEIHLPPTAGEMDESIFADCAALVRVEIPAGWTKLPYGMFWRCQLLESAVFLGNAPTEVSYGVFEFAAPDFKVLYRPRSIGFTIPTWEGYPAKMLDPEIEIRVAGGPLLEDAGVPLDFGNVILGTSAVRDCEIRNTGNTTLDGLFISHDGSPVSEFTISLLDSTSLEPGETVTFQVAFMPAATGKRTSTLHVSSSDVDENPFDITLRGTSVSKPVSEISVSQPARSELADGRSKKSFGTVEVGASGNAKVFTIRNTGDAVLRGLQLRMKGGNYKDFVIPELKKASLPPGDSMAFKVRFKPLAKGQRTSSLQIRSNDTDESPFDIKVAGFGAGR
ncbi:MAG: choice-of-anchor D domain-containing protein [Verrucomicrobiaceae bacterium]|nr:MAG: choice-of-anchor D domain-containing protein [Verrucomicrobiaceae bacterium]